MIRNLRNSDAVVVLDIYQQGLDSGEASFETEAPDWDTGNLNTTRFVDWSGNRMANRQAGQR